MGKKGRFNFEQCISAADSGQTDADTSVHRWSISNNIGFWNNKLILLVCPAVQSYNESAHLMSYCFCSIKIKAPNPRSVVILSTETSCSRIKTSAYNKGEPVHAAEAKSRCWKRTTSGFNHPEQSARIVYPLFPALRLYLFIIISTCHGALLLFYRPILCCVLVEASAETFCNSLVDVRSVSEPSVTETPPFWARLVIGWSETLQLSKVFLFFSYSEFTVAWNTLEKSTWWCFDTENLSFGFILGTSMHIFTSHLQTQGPHCMPALKCTYRWHDEAKY